MAWISVHQQIRDHRKTRDFFRVLKISRQEAIGILVLLWTWAIDNCDVDGLLLSVTKEDISHAAYWTKKPQKLYDALLSTGWIDEDGGNIYLHDWYDFNKPFYDGKERKEKDKLRKIKERKAKMSQGQSNGQPQGQSSEKETESRAEIHDSHKHIHKHIHKQEPEPAPKQEPNVIKKVFVADCIELKLSALLKNKIELNNPNAKTPTSLQSWAKSVDLMIRIDKRTPEQIKANIIKCQNDSFWKTNILSMTALRKQFDKITMLNNSNTNNQPPEEVDDKYANLKYEN